MSENNTLRKLIIVLLVLITLGTFSYFLIGGETLWHSFFLTMIILLSHFKHGGEEPVWEQILTIILILGSYIAVAYILRWAADYFLGGEFKESRRKKRMIKKVEKMSGHYVICGFGRVGSQVAEELFHEKVDFVVIDRDLREVKIATEKGYVAFAVDPTTEDGLNRAGICSAKGLVSCLGEDTDNLFVTLSARSLNPELYIVARANYQENIPKFEKAGANRVATPYQIGGYHMATMALRPGVLDFLDVIVDSRHDELEVEEIEIPRNSFLVGKTIGEAISRDKTGVTILAVNKKDGTSKINPMGTEMIHTNDKIIVMGNREQLGKIADLIG